jgi:hypothetical protein
MIELHGIQKDPSPTLKHIPCVKKRKPYTIMSFFAISWSSAAFNEVAGKGTDRWLPAL